MDLVVVCLLLGKVKSKTMGFPILAFLLIVKSGQFLTISFCYSRDKIEYWNELCPCTGRPNSAAMCKQKNPQAVQKSVVS